MTSKGTIGGGPPVYNICRDCKDWRIQGRCEFWKNYKYGLAKACGYFTERDSGEQTAQKKP